MVVPTHTLSQVDSLLIIVHGAGGKANTYFCNAVAGVSSIKSIGVVAPYFGNETVMLQDWIASSAAGNFSAVGNRTSLFWNGTTFNAGAGTANAKNVSSFDALDALLAHVIRRKGRRLKQVVLAGFSAGGQTVQRYAWASSYGSPADASNSSSVTVKFAISDPGTYLYYDTQRPKQSCRQVAAHDLQSSCCGSCHQLVVCCTIVVDSVPGSLQGPKCNSTSHSCALVGMPIHS
jgi:hypothetical protein